MCDAIIWTNLTSDEGSCWRTGSLRNIMRVLSRKIIIFFNETNLILFIELRKESYDYYKAILAKVFITIKISLLCIAVLDTAELETCLLSQLFFFWKLWKEK